MTYYSIDHEGLMEEHDADTEARGAAEGYLERAIQESADGAWAEGVERIEWGELHPRECAEAVSSRPAPGGGRFDVIVGFALTPVTSESTAVKMLLDERVIRAARAGTGLMLSSEDVAALVLWIDGTGDENGDG